MITFLLIVHALLAVTLIGAVTHQTISVWWPARARTGSFVNSVRSVPSASYANAIVVLFVATAILGGIIYPTYRLNVRSVLQDYRMFVAEGSFELKEHFIAVGLGMLPAYWFFWRKPLADTYARARAIVTTLIAFVAWWGFLVGHVLNNIRGFGS